MYDPTLEDDSADIADIKRVKYVFEPAAANRRLSMPRGAQLIAAACGEASVAIVTAVHAAGHVTKNAALEAASQLDDAFPAADLETAWAAMVASKFLVRSVGLKLPRNLLAGDSKALLSRSTLFALQGRDAAFRPAGAAAAAAATASAVAAANSSSSSSAQPGQKRRRGRPAGSASAKASKSAKSTRAAPVLPAPGTQDDRHDSGDGMLWRLNFRTVQRIALHDVLVEYVKSTMSVATGAVMAATLEAVSAVAGDELDLQSGAVSAQDVWIRLTKAGHTASTEDEAAAAPPNQMKLTWAKFQGLLRVMATDSVALLLRVADTREGGTFRVRISCILRKIVLRAANKWVTGKYGMLGGRVVNMLLARGPCEDKTVSEGVLDTLRVARSQLHELFAGGVILQQECTKRSDRLTSSSIWLWHCSPEHLLRQYMRALERSILRVSCRHAAEFARRERAILLGGIASDHAAAQRTQTVLATMLDKLDVSILRLDRSRELVVRALQHLEAEKRDIE